MKKIYVGNLPFTATEAQLRELFEVHGTVHSVELITQKGGDLPRGFGYVQIDDEALAAALQLNGTTMEGRRLMVSETRPRIVQARPRREMPPRKAPAAPQPDAVTDENTDGNPRTADGSNQ